MLLGMGERSGRALIVGAGVGGPALAMWLGRLGLTAVLAEARAAAAPAEGAWLGVAPNGMNVLDALGLAGRVASKGHACAGFQFTNHRGRIIGTIDRGGDRAAFGWPLTMIRRADLNAALAGAAAERGAAVRYGLRLAAVDAQAPGGVRARFGDGTELEGDFLVGSDGLRSAARALAVPGSPAPTFSGLLDVGGFARGVRGPFPPGVNHMVFGRRAFFGAFATPEGETWWFHNGPPGEGDLRARLLELHRDDPAWITDLLRATPALLGPWRIHELVAMPRWSAGRVCLLGDAAHAMSPSAGQGASLALEDAMALARCLRDEPDPPAAFERFERLRRPRVDAIFKEARRQSARKAPTPLSEWFRDRTLPFFLRFGAAAQSKAYGFTIDWDSRAA